MQKFFGYLFIAGSLLVAASCNSTRQVANPSTKKVDNVAKDYYSLPNQPTPDKVWELIHTDIDISFNLAKKTAEATADLTLHPYFYPSDSISLDAKGMKILSVVYNGNGKSVNPEDDKIVSHKIADTLPFQYTGTKLNMKLPATFQRADTIQLQIHYIAMPYASENTGGQAITSDRGLYFINTNHFEPYQQMQIWTQGETEANSHWFPTFDHTNFRSTFKITMHVPDSFKTLSNGKLVASREEQNGMRADTWVQDIPIPPYLVMMAASNFAVVKDNSWNGKDVAYYVPQEYKDYAKDIFRHTPEMIDFFSKKLNLDYPWNKYNQVIGYDYVSGAMENVSASLFGAFNLKDARQIADDNNDFIIAHELFHQWFGDYVTCENWSQITLNESFADFSEKLWAEYKYGKDEAEIEFYHSKLRYLGQAPNSDLPLVRYRYQHPDDVFDRVSYSKGGMILNYLRKLTGDSAFFDALHLYLTQNALQSTEADQLRLAFEKVTGKDWNWFFNQWYLNGGHPVLDIQYSFDDAAREMTVKVAQVQQAEDYQTKVYVLPLMAQIVQGNHLESFPILIDSEKQSFVFSYEGAERPLFIPDAGHWLPGVIVDHKDFGQWRQQYFAAGRLSADSSANAGISGLGFENLDKMDLMSRHDALLGIFAKKGKIGDVRIDSVFKAAIESDPSAFIRLTAINLLVKMNIPGNKIWKDFFYKVASSDKDNKVKAAAISWLGQRKDEQYRNFYEKKTDDASYYIAAAALTALNEINHHRAETIARGLLGKNRFSAYWLEIAGQIIGQNGNPEDYAFFSNVLWHKFEGDRALFMDSFAEYLLNVSSDSVFYKGLALIDKLAEKEGQGSRFQFPMYGNVYTIYRELNTKLKAASGKEEKEHLKAKRDKAFSVWQEYVASVKNENTLAIIKANGWLPKGK